MESLWGCLSVCGDGAVGAENHCVTMDSSFANRWGVGKRCVTAQQRFCWSPGASHATASGLCCCMCQDKLGSKLSEQHAPIGTAGGDVHMAGGGMSVGYSGLAAWGI